ncbi:MAG: sigma-70 family RNA polymerase sigma factor [Clostridia bacterium]|nr:sigma-70 family RNA polymerase sigma factor [Clostridia bacterium]
MEDYEIITLYNQRNENAIAETEQKYGPAIRAIAQNLLGDSEDAEECLNDTLSVAWNSSPPACPENLKFWLFRVVRNKAIAVWRHGHFQKRNNEMETMLSELEECVPSPENTEGAIEAAELSKKIAAWLRTLTMEDRNLFQDRYYRGISVSDLAKNKNVRPQKISKRLFYLRQALRKKLEKEELWI